MNGITTRIPSGIRTESDRIPSAYIYIDTRHATYISTPQHACSAFHHDYRKVDARDPATIVAPDPVTAPDAMMSLTAIEHLDFEPEVPCEHSRHRARHADESAAFLVQVIGFCHLGGGERYALCRSGYALSWRVGVLCPVCRSPFTEPGQEPPLRIVQVLR